MARQTSTPPNEMKMKTTPEFATRELSQPALQMPNTSLSSASAFGGRKRGMAGSKPRLALACLIATTLCIASTLMAHDEGVTPLMSNDLEEVSGKEVLMYTVDFKPGHSSPVHRHNAQVSLYVLEGTVVMQVKGGKAVTLKPGQSFYESRNDVHVVSRNASKTKPAKFLVFMVKDKGAPLLKLEK
jgi:quercetin dioxygenase-like cupin family protein